MYFVLHLKMISVWETGFYLDLSDCAPKRMPIFYFRAKDSFPVNRILDFARILLFNIKRSENEM